MKILPTNHDSNNRYYINMVMWSWKSIAAAENWTEPSHLINIQLIKFNWKRPAEQLTLAVWLIKTYSQDLQYMM